MAAIAADRLAGREPEDDDVPMENMVVDDPAPTLSSVPSSVVHCTMTIGEARAQYMVRVRQMREEQFREAHPPTMVHPAKCEVASSHPSCRHEGNPKL